MILYRNDKKRIILYELLMMKRNLTWGEKLVYKYLVIKRMLTDKERTLLLNELQEGGYISLIGNFHLYGNVYSSEIRLRKKEITPNGEELLKKELPLDVGDGFMFRAIAKLISIILSL